MGDVAKAVDMADPLSFDCKFWDCVQLCVRRICVWRRPAGLVTSRTDGTG